MGLSATALPFLVQGLITAVAYPLVASVAAKIHRRLAISGS
jgi:hypothetical protein